MRRLQHIVACLAMVAATVTAASFFGGPSASVAAPPPGKGGGGGGGDGDGGGGSVPAGTIFYSYDGDEYAMKADGSGKTPTDFPPPYPSITLSGDLSSLVYGSDPTFDRWSLQLLDVGVDEVGGWTIRELFAVRPFDADDGTIGYDMVQLTDLYPHYFVPGPENQRPQWSNDGEDSFVSFRASERGIDENGNPYLVKSHLLRLNVSGLLIDVANSEGIDLNVKPGDEELLESVISSPSLNAWTFSAHHFSRDATKLAYLENDPAGSFKLMVADFTAGTIKTMPVSPYQFQWSPTNDRLLFASDGIKTMAADGTDIQIVLENTGTTSYGFANWSPDGEHIVYGRSRQKGIDQFERYIERIALSGGKPVLLSGDLNKALSKAPRQWLSDTSAFSSP